MIPPGGVGTLELAVHGDKLHLGRAQLMVELSCTDPRSDTSLVLRGQVVPWTGMIPVLLHGADLLIR